LYIKYSNQVSSPLVSIGSDIVLYVPHETATRPEEIEAIFFTGALADLLSFIDREELLALFPEISPLRCTRAGEFRPVVVLSHDHGNHFTLYRE
jgi:hypothetical protein